MDGELLAHLLFYDYTTWAHAQPSDSPALRRFLDELETAYLGSDLDVKEVIYVSFLENLDDGSSIPGNARAGPQGGRRGLPRANLIPSDDTARRPSEITAVALSKSDQKRFDAAQEDEKFLAWVEMNDDILEFEIDEDIPDLPAKPWDAEALRVAERHALTQIPEQRMTFDEDHQERSWKIVRLLGQTFVDAFEGQWVNLPGLGSSRPTVAVDLPFRSSFYVEPVTLLTAAMKRRTGEEWARVFGYAEEDYAEYVKARETAPS